MKKIIVLLFLSTLSFSAAHAAGGYGASGCGLGSLVFDTNENKNEWWAQVLAATTNAILGNQTFGITSGTLNCDANPLVQVSHVETFIESNENAVANELAKGEGDTLVVLNYAFRCQNTEVLGAAIKKNYSKIYTGESDTPKAVASRINTLAGSVESCSAI
jgi:hypothetical protein